MWLQEHADVTIGIAVGVAVVLGAAVVVWMLPPVAKRRARRRAIQRFRQQAEIDFDRGFADAVLPTFDPLPAPAASDDDVFIDAVVNPPTDDAPDTVADVTPEVVIDAVPETVQHFVEPAPAAPAAQHEPVEAPDSQPLARQLSSPPPGYVPLEMPELWEPEPEPAHWESDVAVAAAARGSGDEWQDPEAVQIRMLPRALPPAVEPFIVQVAEPVYAEPVSPEPVYPQSVAPQPVDQTPVAHGQVLERPRSLADLRVGPLAGRVFESPQHLAVAAVREAGFSALVVGRLFRVPAWRIDEWILAAERQVERPPRRGTVGLRAGR